MALFNQCGLASTCRLPIRQPAPGDTHPSLHKKVEASDVQRIANLYSGCGDHRPLQHNSDRTGGIAMNEERRISPRVFMPYPAKLHGVDAAGRAWEESVLVDNVSAGGLYLRMNRVLQKEACVFAAVRLSTVPPAQSSALRLSARGVVVRAEPQPDGTCGVALVFTHRRVLMKANAAHAFY